MVFMICVKCGKEAPDAPFCALCGWKQSKPIERRTRRGNGQGYVYKRGSIWYAQITLYSTSEVVNGKKVYRRKTRTKGGFKTKKDALDHIANLSTNQGRRMPTLLELYTQFEKTDLPKLSKDKQSSYKKARERIDALMGREIDGLTVAEMQEVTDTQATSYYTARDIKTLFSKLYQKAMPDKYVTVNLSQYIVLPELNEAEATPFSSEEVQKIWNAFTDGSEIAGDMLVMIYTGMMPGELFSCRKDMIDYDKCEIYGCGKKTKKRKEVPIVFPDFLAPVIEFIALHLINGCVRFFRTKVDVSLRRSDPRMPHKILNDGGAQIQLRRFRAGRMAAGVRRKIADADALRKLMVLLIPM